MPELPEVETIVKDLRKNIIGRSIVDVWTDAEELIIKKPKRLRFFKKEIKGRKIKAVRRRAKNILIDLSQGKTLLVHQKMTGHLLVGKWKKVRGGWISELKGPLLDDARNRFLHLIFFLDDGTQLALSDQRKFAKAELWDKEELDFELSEKIGPEPLESSFTLRVFKEVLAKRKRGRIKDVLMDQKVIAGIGNIYADEILWQTRINPTKDVKQLKQNELKAIHGAIKRVLLKGVELQGDSFYSFRRVDGTKGGFSEWAKVYGREGEECRRCKTIIKRKKLGARSAHFCPKCQPILT